MEVRLRTSRLWLHVPLEQTVLAHGRRPGRDKPHVRARRLEGQALNLISGMELGTDFPGIPHVGHATTLTAPVRGVGWTRQADALPGLVAVMDRLRLRDIGHG